MRGSGVGPGGSGRFFDLLRHATTLPANGATASRISSPATIGRIPVEANEIGPIMVSEFIATAETKGGDTLISFAPSLCTVLWNAHC